MVYTIVFGGLVLAGALLATLKSVRKADVCPNALNLR